ncbi:flagellar basal-body rod modification protein FlgD [alpha proteobacterium U9-1i]|nr:flagellar basal-body rod modification protein FlgD [alpha proteobacterium U9-1i]
MAIDPISAASQSQAGSDRGRLSDNYDTFLVLLTAQLQNQDPLAPMDSTQFTQQLVQFSQVEQQIRTNEQLEGLVGQYQAASAGAALSYIGKSAIVEGNETVFGGGENDMANWAYRLDDPATSVNIKIKNAAGATVFETNGARAAGEHLFAWDGTMTNGQTAPAGEYRMVVEATDAEAEAMSSVITVREMIMGVDFSGTTPLIITPTGTRGLDTVRSVLDG